MRKHPGMRPRTAAGGSEGREAGGGRLGYHPERRGGEEMSWLLPPPLPLGSLSKAAKPPLPPQEGGWGGWREVHWLLEWLNATLLLELFLLLSDSSSESVSTSWMIRTWSLEVSRQSSASFQRCLWACHFSQPQLLYPQLGGDHANPDKRV